MKKSAPAYAPLFPELPMRENAVLAPGEIVVVNFAGGGGASEGIAQAMGRPVNIAINHNPVALSVHRLNHPHTTHYIEDVWHVDPREAVAGRPVALAQFSPDCTHFSKARGGKPRSRKVRGLAWVAVRWAATVRPRVIILENVKEFMTWGPLDAEGQPIEAQEGRTYRSFLNALERQGYVVEWRVLRACDYGSGTTRTRFFLIARCDGRPITWPEPTHAAPDDPRVLAGQLKSWPVAADFIDWSLPVPSVFDRKKPLVHATLRRIALGFERYTLRAAQPYIVNGNHSGPGFRGQALGEPLRTITASHEALGLTTACLMENNHDNAPNSPEQPLSTVTTQSNRHLLTTACLAKAYGGHYDGPGIAVTGPLDTITLTDHHQLVTVQLTAYYSRGTEGDPGQAAGVPLRTIPTVARFGLTTACLYRNFGTTKMPPPVTAPAPTIMTSGDGGKVGVSTAELEMAPTAAMLARARQVYALLLTHLGAEALAGHADHAAQLVHLEVAGRLFVVWDLCMRMLEPAELYGCQGFPASYVISRTAEGKKLSKKAQIEHCGNSVPPHPMQALTLSNMTAPYAEAAD